MKFKDRSAVQVLVGLQQVGLVGLREALRQVAASGIVERELIVDRLIEILEDDNYIRNRHDDLLRTALWREYLRSAGEEFSEFYSEIPVIVRGGACEERDHFLETIRSVFGEHELKPVFTLEPAGGKGPNPQLVVNEETIVRGYQKRQDLKTAIGKSISGW
jgi:hypothetical protein